MSAVRDAILAALDVVVGWTTPDQRYLDLISPGNSRAQQLQDAQKSDCILVALGVEEMVLDCPPHGRDRPQVTLEERAGGTPMRPSGAMRHATFDNPPQAGDAVWYGPSASVNSEHVEHVRAVSFFASIVGGDLDRACATVTAGGERDTAGNETIKQLVRNWEWHNAWVDRTTGRPIIGVVDADDLVKLYPIKAA